MIRLATFPFEWEIERPVRPSADENAPVPTPDETLGREMGVPEIVTDCGSAKAMGHISFVG
jgi:hypothetical protein